MPQRIDRGRIWKSEATEEGFLRVWMSVSKVGDLIYFNEDGTQRTEYVSPQTLSDPDALDTAWGKSITLEHPEEMVTAENARELSRGMTQNAMFLDNGFLTIVGVLTDKEAIGAVADGTNQVSAGYFVTVDEEDGRLVQRDRMYNHFAIVPQGRAGADVKIHLDTFRCDAVSPEDIEKFNLSNSEEKNVSDNLRKITLDSIEFQVAPDLATAISKLIGENQTLQTDKSNLQGNVEGLKVKISELEAQNLNRMDDAQIASEIQKRLDIWGEVLPSFGRQFAPDYSLSASDIKRLYLGEVKKQNIEGRSDTYIDGLYEGLKPSPEQQKTDAINKTRSHLNQIDYDDEPNNIHLDAVESARMKAIERREKAYYSVLGDK